ncbi:MAG TPA: SRPBCC family protein [Longimicrobiales bacterium]|nr:SRPBCC family protein [Longimicrobiales bacterium]
MRKGEHVFRAQTSIPLPVDQVFAFFAAAENLEDITPPELRFRIATSTPIVVGQGTIIDYRLSLFGLSFNWKTEISVWRPPFEFVDTQLKGPYAQWIHRHTFQERDGQTDIMDEVRYRLPLFPFGEVALPLVKLQIRRIFEYRALRIREILVKSSKTGKS